MTLKIFLFSLFSLFYTGKSSAVLADLSEEIIGKVVCYYDIPGKFSGKEVFKNNYVWGRNIHEPTKPLVLQGKIHEGFFEPHSPYLLTYQDLQESCDFALSQDPAKKLYDIKFSVSEFTKAEYPIYLSQDTSITTPIKKIVVFGDSLSDTGNLKNWARIFGNYAEPGKNYWHGRFADGPMWVDFLQYLTNIPVLNWTYGASITEKVSLREKIGGIFTTNMAEANNSFLETQDAVFRKIVGSMDLYIDKYLKNSDQLRGNPLKNSENTLFIVWTGANDYFTKFVSSEVLIQFLNPEKKEYEKMINSSINALEQNLRVLITQAHAKYFLIPTLPDLGIPPYVAIDDTYIAKDAALGSIESRTELALQLTLVTKLHNQKLLAMLDKMRQDAQIQSSGVHIITQDIAANLDSMFTNKDFDYGFTPLLSNFVVRNPLTGVSTRIDKPCMIRGKSGIAPECQHTPNRARFWDTGHISSYANCFLAHIFQETLAKNGLLPEPQTLEEQKQYCQSGKFFNPPL